MAWTSPITFVTGNVLTAAQMNTYVRDNTNFVHSPPGCLATVGGTQSIATATNTACNFTLADIYDTDSMHDNVGAPSIITINTTGVYFFWGAREYAPNNTGRRSLGIEMVNPGVEIAVYTDPAPLAATNSVLNVSGTYKVTAGVDTVRLLTIQTSGVALNLLGTASAGIFDSAAAFFGAQWISDGT